jgi:hypothetical protein
MATVLNIVKPALQLILVQASEADLEADEYADSIDALNAMMADLEVNGIHLGWTDVDSVSDTVTVAPGAIRGIIYNLAVEMAPQFDAEPTIALADRAEKGMVTLRLLGQTVGDIHYPSTLPYGSGQGYSYAENYYPATPDGTYTAVKDPDSIEPFTIDWADKLTPLGDTISTSSWAADAGVTVDSDTNTTLTATAVVSGGDSDGICQLVNTIVTASGNKLERTYLLTLRDQ